MTPFTKLTALACPLPAANIDTDQLIPARFMKEPRDKGYGPFLLHDLRFDADGEKIPGFNLNNPLYENAEVLVAQRNFGAGSSREAAVYALVDYGIRCVISPSFGDIFTNNSVNNGLLPAIVSEEDCKTMLELLANGSASVDIDLEKQKITIGEHIFDFEISDSRKVKLLNGWDDIDMTLSYQSDIDGFISKYKEAFPWAQA